VFDLYLFSLNLVDNQNLPDLPGFFAASAPKKASRIRTEDVLLMLLSMTGGEPFSPASLDELFQKLTKTFFSSTGTVTAGMRSMAEQLNSSLLERNLKNTTPGEQAIGLFNLAVFHHDRLYLTQCGPAHAFILGSSSVQDYTQFDNSRGVGSGQSLGLHFYQQQIEPGDVLVFTPHPPASWNETSLASGARLTLDHLRRRLLNQCGPNLRAGVAQFQKGKGQIHRLRLRTSMPLSGGEQPPAQAVKEESLQEPAAETPAATGKPAAVTAPQPIKTPPVEQHQPTPPSARLPAAPSQPVADRPVAAPAAGAQPVKLPQPVPLPGIYLGGEKPAEITGQPAGRAAHRPRPGKLAPDKPAKPATPAPPKKTGPSLRQRLARLWLAGRSTQRRTAEGSKALFTRMMPGADTTPPTFSGGSLLFIAVIIPLLVVAAAMTVYFRKGQSAQQTLYLQQAQQFMTQAATEKDAALKRSDWNQALHWVDKAEEYGRTDETRALHNRAQQALDNLEGIIRLDMKPAVKGGFASSIKIIRMVASDTDVYMLDGNSGRVLRIFLTGQGYTVDSQFVCGPGPAGGGIIIGKLIDIAAVPPTSPNKATLLGLDAGGNMLYCAPGDTAPLSVALPQDSYWGQISALSFQQYVAYILDSGLSTVWMFKADSNLGFGKSPSQFFGLNGPKDMAKVIDMAVYKEDLYLLYKDGKMVRCTYSDFSFSSTRCIDPYPYVDERPGHESHPVTVPDTQFTQIQEIDPYSLYVLDVKSPSIYHFSVTLTLQQQLQPDPHGEYILPTTPPTAFTVTQELSASRKAFLAYDNLVYYSPLP